MNNLRRMIVNNVQTSLSSMQHDNNVDADNVLFDMNLADLLLQVESACALRFYNKQLVQTFDVEKWLNQRLRESIYSQQDVDFLSKKFLEIFSILSTYPKWCAYVSSVIPLRKRAQMGSRSISLLNGFID